MCDFSQLLLLIIHRSCWIPGWFCKENYYTTWSCMKCVLEYIDPKSQVKGRVFFCVCKRRLPWYYHNRYRESVSTKPPIFMQCWFSDIFSKCDNRKFFRNGNNHKWMFPVPTRITLDQIQICIHSINKQKEGIIRLSSKYKEVRILSVLHASLRLRLT